MMIKEFLKKNDFLRKKVKKYKIKREYLNDYKEFIKYYNESNNNINIIEYKILLIIHSLEKGMCNSNLRPFGSKKIIELIKLMNLLKYNNNNYNINESSVFKMGYECIKKWLEIIKQNNWTSIEYYQESNNFIKNNNINIKDVKVGTMVYTSKDRIEYCNLDYKAAISERHSVRNFMGKEIKNEDVKYCIEAALKSPSACNRQMCKIYYITSKNKKELLNKNIVGLSGFNKEKTNYFVITYDISSFTFFGERNQGYFNAGLFAMNFVNALHFKNIGSCFLQWGNKFDEEVIIKNKLGIPSNEKIVVVLGAGYYLEKNLVPCSNRKKIYEVYKEL